MNPWYNHWFGIDYIHAQDRDQESEQSSDVQVVGVYSEDEGNVLSDAEKNIEFDSLEGDEEIVRPKKEARLVSEEREREREREREWNSAESDYCFNRKLESFLVVIRVCIGLLQMPKKKISKNF